MIKVYLSGKIRNISYTDGTDWRNIATEILQTESGGDVETLDPMRNKEFLAGSDAMPRSTEHLYAQPRNVFARDCWDVRQCDIVLADLRTGNGRFTMFEIGMAYGLGKPIVLVSDNPEVDDSICLQFAPAAVFSTLEPALDFILSLANRK